MAGSANLQGFAFLWQRATIGTVYHYLKSNLDGTYPARVSVYWAEMDELQVLKREAHQMDAVLVWAKLDWQLFSARELTTYLLLPDRTVRRMAQMWLLADQNQIQVQVGQQQGKLELTYYPFHIYNFDFISLCAAFPHWTEPEGTFTIAVVQPTFDSQSDQLIRLEGLERVEYEGEEELHGVVCRRYRLNGEGLRGCVGYLWANKLSGIVEKIAVPIPDNPDWDSFLFELQGVEEMDKQAWQAFIDSEVEKLG